MASASGRRAGSPASRSALAARLDTRRSLGAPRSLSALRDPHWAPALGRRAGPVATLSVYPPSSPTLHCDRLCSPSGVGLVIHKTVIPHHVPEPTTLATHQRRHWHVVDFRGESRSPVGVLVRPPPQVPPDPSLYTIFLHFAPVEAPLLCARRGWNAALRVRSTALPLGRLAQLSS